MLDTQGRRARSDEEIQAQIVRDTEIAESNPHNQEGIRARRRLANLSDAGMHSRMRHNAVNFTKDRHDRLLLRERDEITSLRDSVPAYICAVEKLTDALLLENNDVCTLTAAINVECDAAAEVAECVRADNVIACCNHTKSKNSAFILQEGAEIHRRSSERVRTYAAIISKLAALLTSECDCRTANSTLLTEASTTLTSTVRGSIAFSDYRAAKMKAIGESAIVNECAVNAAADSKPVYERVIEATRTTADAVRHAAQAAGALVESYNNNVAALKSCAAAHAAASNVIMEGARARMPIDAQGRRNSYISNDTEKAMAIISETAVSDECKKAHVAMGTAMINSAAARAMVAASIEHSVAAAMAESDTHNITIVARQNHANIIPLLAQARVDWGSAYVIKAAAEANATHLKTNINNVTRKPLGIEMVANARTFNCSGNELVTRTHHMSTMALSLRTLTNSRVLAVENMYKEMKVNAVQEISSQKVREYNKDMAGKAISKHHDDVLPHHAEIVARGTPGVFGEEQQIHTQHGFMHIARVYHKLQQGEEVFAMCYDTELKKAVYSTLRVSQYAGPAKTMCILTAENEKRRWLPDANRYGQTEHSADDSKSHPQSNFLSSVVSDDLAVYAQIGVDSARGGKFHSDYPH